MDTHSKDLLYGFSSPTVSSDGDTAGSDVGRESAPAVGSVFDTGQGSGESHIRFEKKSAEKKHRPGSLLKDGEPTPAFDEFGNPVVREEEGSGGVPLI